MKGIPNIKASTLNKNVRLVGSTKVAEESDLLKMTIPIKTKGSEDFTYPTTLKEFLSAFADDKIIMRDGKPYVHWLHSSIIVENLNYSKMRAGWYSEPFREILTNLFELLGEQRFDYVSITQQSQNIEATVRRKANPDKKGLVSVKNAVRAVGEFCEITNTEEVIKLLYTQVNQQDKVLYTYETDCFIEQHYNQLHKTSRLITCMNRGIDDDRLSQTHLVRCDLTAVEKSRTVMEEKALAFTANVEGFNHSPNVRLLITSWKSPEELATSAEYGFIGRAVALVEDGSYKIVKYYGLEGTKQLLPDNVSFTDTLKGAIVRGYVSHNEYVRCEWGRPARYILPYIDGEDNVMRMSDEDYTDDIGRPYKLFTVVEGHKYRMDSYRDNDPIDKVVLSQQSWVSQPVDYNGIYCAITGEELTFTNSLKYEGQYVYWKFASEDANVIKEALYIIDRKLSYANEQYLKYKTRLETLQGLHKTFSNKVEGIKQ